MPSPHVPSPSQNTTGQNTTGQNMTGQNTTVPSHQNSNNSTSTYYGSGSGSNSSSENQDFNTPPLFSLPIMTRLANLASNVDGDVGSGLSGGDLSELSGLSSGAFSGVLSAGNRGLHLELDEEKLKGISHPGLRSAGSKNIEPVTALTHPFTINVPIIIASGVIFIAILAWFEVLRSLYDRTWEFADQPGRYQVTIERLGYAVMVTCLCIILIYIFFQFYKTVTGNKQLTVV